MTEEQVANGADEDKGEGQPSHSGGPAIGIDLGTTYSCVAVWQHGKAEVVVNGQGNRITPSVVAFSSNGDRLVGDAAINQVGRNPAGTIFDTKRLIGRKFSDPIVQSDAMLWPFKVVSGENDTPEISVDHDGEERRFSAEAISSMILDYMSEVSQAQLGQTVRKAVVTVPAYFNNAQRQATLDAGAAAGLNVMRVVNEPTAAAIAYGLDRSRWGSGAAPRKKRNVLVFDLGGGTFDVSILAMGGGGGGVKVLATAGDSHLGGVDFDMRMVDHFALQFRRKNGGLDVSSDRRAIRRLRTECERAKRILSFAVETTVEVESLYDGIDFSCAITAAKFEELNMDLFQRCMDLVDTCLSDAQIDKSAVDDVVLVGGSTRIPKIQDLINEAFPSSAINKSLNPDEAVAIGAAIHAAALGGDATQSVDGLLLLDSDITPLSLGIRTAGGVMSVLIPRNTPVPASHERHFTTSLDGQSIITFQVYEGERAMTRDNHLLGKFELPGIPLGPAGKARVAVRFEVDSDGILVVTAEDQAGGGRARIQITDHYQKMAVGKVRQMLDDAESNKTADEVSKRRVVARLELENYARLLRQWIDAGKAKGKANEVEKAVKEAEVWVQRHWLAPAVEIDGKRRDLEELWLAVENGTELPSGYSSVMGKTVGVGSREQESPWMSPVVNFFSSRAGAREEASGPRPAKKGFRRWLCTAASRVKS